MDKMDNQKIENLQMKIGQWVEKHTKIVTINENEIIVNSSQFDAYGNTIYCFVQRTADRTYRVGDDGHMLFKLDPGVSDLELCREAIELILGSGFDFNFSTFEISITASEEDLVDAIFKLERLQLALSYLN